MMIHIQEQDQFERLWRAAMTGDSATIRILAMKGIDLDARNKDNCTAFELAQRYNHPSTAKAILAAREFQFLRKIGIELERIGNFNPAARRHYNAYLHGKVRAEGNPCHAMLT
jgi:hypothetical protein